MIKFKEFSILLEKDNRSKIVKFLSSRLGAEAAQLLADEAHKMSDKHSIIIANIIANTIRSVIGSYKLTDPLLKDIIRRNIEGFINNGTLENLLTLLSIQKKPTIDYKSLTASQIYQYITKYNHMESWIKNSGEWTPELTWEEATKKTDEYYDSFETGTPLKVKPGQEILDNIFDGEQFIEIDGKKHYWLNLKVKYCKDEEDASGHCAKAEIGKLFSLRTIDGIPKLTADIDTYNEISGQIYANANTKPKVKYHKAILYLLGHYDISKVLPKNYKEESFNPEKDLSNELKEWYEDKFNLELTTGGISPKERKAVDELIDEFNNTSYYVGLSIDHYGDEDEYISPSVGITYDYSDYDITLLNKEVREIFGYNGEWYDNSYREYLDQGDSDFGSFNATRDSDYVDWANGIITNCEYYEGNAPEQWADYLKAMINEDYVSFEDDPILETITKTALEIDDGPLFIAKGITHNFIKANWEFEFPGIVSITFSFNLQPILMKQNKKIITRTVKDELTKYLNKKNIVKKIIDSKIHYDPNQLKFDFMKESTTLKSLSTLVNQPWYFTTKTSAYLLDTWGYLYLTKYIKLDGKDLDKVLLEAYKLDINYNEVMSLISDFIQNWSETKKLKQNIARR